ncbi:MAG: 1-phosphofructokinase family hexose kinase [Verrucomicrobia bacterium]|nr:1-phosphofructokinase family hexose kinase [Verrucomicrobiota bacterium]
MSALVLALNPSIDAEWRVDDVIWEEKNNVQFERRWAGGKGINVARWLKHLGGKPKLFLPLGGVTGDELARYIREERISTSIIPLAGPTRVNVIITTGAGRQMRFNPLGPKLTKPEWKIIVERVESRLGQGSLLILSGSLPRGVPLNAYAHLITRARKHGVRTLLDCDGDVLIASIPSRPFLVKPNEHELARWFGRPLRTEKDVVRAARALSEKTRGWVFVSRGAGASLLLNVQEQFQTFARPARVKPRNTVGAGDALLAGVARQIQLGTLPSEWLEHGLSVGTRATQCLPGHVS